MRFGAWGLGLGVWGRGWGVGVCFRLRQRAHRLERAAERTGAFLSCTRLPTSRRSGSRGPTLSAHA